MMLRASRMSGLRPRPTANAPIISWIDRGDIVIAMSEPVDMTPGYSLDEKHRLMQFVVASNGAVGWTIVHDGPPYDGYTRFDEL